MFQPGASLTFNNAKTVLEAGLRAIADGQTTVDFSGLTAVDSAAVAVLLAWRRCAQADGATLSFTNMPQNLRSLISLYDVEGLLGANPTVAFPNAARADLPHH
jgi:phospholipid transport system transporter-binding protein